MSETSAPPTTAASALPVIAIRNLSKTYASGHQALKQIDLDIRAGEIFALLGPNGAGKTTLISIVCGLVNPSTGTVQVAGHDIVRDYRAARSAIGLVPQELTTDAFETVWDSVRFTRGLFGKTPDPAGLERILRSLSLWDKRDSKLMTLSGGMKRRVMIAKALSHEPAILFLDEPTAGVDVALRKDMWNLVRSLRATGVTIILTTHYIEEAEEMADRVGIINRGQLLLVERKASLMRQLGQKGLTLHLQEPLSRIPDSLKSWPLDLAEDGRALRYRYESPQAGEDVPALMAALQAEGLRLADLDTEQRSLEDIFVDLIGGPA
ncbi:ABC transporter ATP-binding protein [uncultured Castellaniella sp.]|uniref:ABC transporter ATP-binding protein n=1 Tax=uncultured Castellaniella sp. TaxID=647907 RepID=UPI0026280BDF|nr:ABC transporter ATP-binding protein [uncultured Castellaniella sp.]